MTKVRSTFRLATIDFHKWLRNPRVYVVFVGLLFFVYHYNRDIRVYCETSGYRITPYLITFMLSRDAFLFIFLLFATLLLCNAPFIDNLTPYDLIRSSRVMWFASRLIYIALASFVFVLVFFLITLIVLFPYIVWLDDWGQVVRTLAIAGPSGSLNVPHISNALVEFSAPIRLTIYTVANYYLQCVVLGLIMFCAGLATKSRGFGIVLATMYSFLPWVHILWGIPGFVKAFPPLWVNQLRLRPANRTAILSQPQALLVLVGFIILLSVASWLALAKRDIEVYPEI